MSDSSSPRAADTPAARKPRDGFPVPSRRPETLARATAFIDERAGLGITIDDVAEAAGVSPRALQLTFRRHLDLTPTGYMRQVRMERAHQELQEAQPGDGTTVTRVALDWGFASPSRFAAYYRCAYGRPPHETLHGWPRTSDQSVVAGDASQGASAAMSSRPRS